MNGTMPYRGAIYLRLSKDDESRRESSSISSQRRLLMSYAKEHDFSIVKEYSDDGWSGTTFDRPAFQEMIQDVKKGSINLILQRICRVWEEIISFQASILNFSFLL